MNCTTSPFFLVNGFTDVAPSPHFNIPLEGYHFVRFVTRALQHRLTRSSVGMTIGRPSVYIEKGHSVARDILGLLVEFLGFLKGAFEEYPGLFRRPTPFSFLPRSEAASELRARAEAICRLPSRLRGSCAKPPRIAARERRTEPSRALLSRFLRCSRRVPLGYPIAQGRPDKATAYLLRRVTSRRPVSPHRWSSSPLPSVRIGAM